jgi:antitoxin FitA
VVAIQVRGVSDAVRDALAGEADRRGVSLQVYLAEVLEREAASARNLAWLREAANRQRPIGRSTTRDEIRQGWQERDERVRDAAGIDDASVTV